MAQSGNDWNSFMQSKPARIVMNGLCAVICGAYAVGGALDLVRPSESALVLAQQIGTTGFYALTVARIAVCVWVAVVFGRLTIRTLREE